MFRRREACLETLSQAGLLNRFPVISPVDVLIFTRPGLVPRSRTNYRKRTFEPREENHGQCFHAEKSLLWPTNHQRARWPTIRSDESTKSQVQARVGKVILVFSFFSFSIFGDFLYRKIVITNRWINVRSKDCG